MTRNLLNFGLVFSIFVSERVTGVHIQFYRNLDFTGLSYESNSTTTCTNLPDDHKSVFINSIKTDTCLMVYILPNCQSFSRKFNLDNSLGWTYRLRSFHICNEDVGGSQLNVDITKWFDMEKPTEAPDILESHKNVCTCINISASVQNLQKWSINNNGNDFLAYYEPDCEDYKWKPELVPAGNWRGDGSTNIFQYEKFDITTNSSYKIQSVGPNLNSAYFRTSCTAYMAQWIMKLESEKFINYSSTNTSTRLIFFSTSDFRGIHWETQSTDACQNIPITNNSRGITNQIGSVKAYQCVILYSDYDCKGYSIKLGPEGSPDLSKNWDETISNPITLATLYTKFPEWKWVTGSFHSCNGDEGGITLNVDITNYLTDSSLSTKPFVYESYRNVCSCINIPNDVQILDKWSLENHGNSMMAYFGYNCSSVDLTPLWIPAGRSSYSTGMGLFQKINGRSGNSEKIKSIGPDPNSIYFQSICNIKIFGEFDQIKVLDVKLEDHLSSRLYALENYIEELENESRANHTTEHVLKLHNSDFQKVSSSVEELKENNVNISAKIRKLEWENQICLSKLFEQEERMERRIGTLENMVKILEKQSGMIHQENK